MAVDYRVTVLACTCDVCGYSVTVQNPEGASPPPGWDTWSRASEITRFLFACPVCCDALERALERRAAAGK